jgi:hypothetical protein
MAKIEARPTRKFTEFSTNNRHHLMQKFHSFSADYIFKSGVTMALSMRGRLNQWACHAGYMALRDQSDLSEIRTNKF